MENIKEIAEFWENKAELTEIEGDILEAKCCRENAEYYYKLAENQS